MSCNNPIHKKGCTCKAKKCPDCGKTVVLPYHPPESKLQMVKNR